MDIDKKNRELLMMLMKAGKITEAPTTTRRHGPWKEVVIGIGADHVAYLTMDDEAYEELFGIKYAAG